MITSKFTILKSMLPIGINMPQKKDWENMVIEFLINYLNSKKYALFELEPSSHSLLYEYPHKKVNIHKKPCVFVPNINLSDEEIKTLVCEQDFYLGSIVIVTSEVFYPENVFESWGENLYESSLEIITLKNDGLGFYVYNPTEVASNLFLNTFENK